MSDVAGVVVLVARILIGGYFIVFARIMGHIMGSKGMEQYAGAMRFPAPGIAGWPTGIWLVLFAELGPDMPYTLTDSLISI